ncbi:hypothetical protein NitYY0814_C1329 [Nitratiruptor sp. YY08-14]|nr:hypothetical protein NitYY0810_C1322 [Nitratiruptor sp. YY08-10]BCD64482.1 hypothetical protein NitYY0814_C1329 [Nitratiruptor sp. YY08-14]
MLYPYMVFCKDCIIMKFEESLIEKDELWQNCGDFGCGGRI